MSYCLNPSCPAPQNPEGTNFCLNCGSKLILRERYRAIKPIGQGGFGRTFLAVDEDKPSKPPCVIKQFFPQAQGTSTLHKAIELFNQEAVRLDELGRHPQIPELLAYFTQDDRQYLVQEFIDGRNLMQELAEEGAFNETKVRQVLNDLLPVLQFVHEQQVIHRDIKPENVIRRKSDRKLVLVDFGASKIVTGTALQRTGTSIGSPEYVAPEQVRGRAIFASDIYSLGVTCIHLLTQMSPFDLYDINQDTWVWRQCLTRPVNETLGKILDKMIATVPSQRYQSAKEVLKNLNPHQPSVVPPPPPIQKAPVQPVASPPPPSKQVVQKPPTSSKSGIDLELEELKSEFLTPGSVKTPQQKPPSSSQNKSSSQVERKQNQQEVDWELEQLRSEFLGSSTPKKPDR